jgi:hypothetical protein
MPSGNWPGPGSVGEDHGVIGAAIIVVVLLVLIPVGVLMSGGAFAAVLDALLTKHAEDENEGSELLAIDRKQAEIYADRS